MAGAQGAGTGPARGALAGVTLERMGPGGSGLEGRVRCGSGGAGMEGGLEQGDVGGRGDPEAGRRRS